MKIRSVFNKKNYLKYISHLDLVRLFQRCFNMADIPVKFSQGYNPHPLHSISNPLSLGFESEGEFLDVELEEEMDANDFKDRMNKVLPADIQILRSEKLETKESINNLIDWSYYEIKFILNRSEDYDLNSFIVNWLKEDKVIVTKSKKKGKRKIESKVNIRPLIGNITLKGRDNNGFIIIETLLRSGEDGNLNPKLLMGALKEDLDEIVLESLMVKRLNVFSQNGNEIKSLL